MLRITTLGPLCVAKRSVLTPLMHTYLTLVPPKVHYIPHTSICLFWILERKIRDFVDTALEAYKPLP